MSSPARSSVSVASGGVVSVAEDVADSIDALYRKDEAVAEALQKEVRSLDEDSWMFAAPRSRIHLVSRPGKTTKMGVFIRCLPAQATRETRGAGPSI
ncbi:hypothetical protein HU200_018793 [Digitaria exilis]|uniref:Uncharacterized protein n=1 Tax=Digitaria exilis TaxID=1010633 RepID=A0A835KGU7_9POAL|nr:hypothetical protein HU200_018793 [Digitaria exilis]